jgi:hypothetical protein
MRASLMLLLMLIAGRVAADEPDVLLLALRVDGELLSDSVQAMTVRDEVRLPVGEIGRLLELDVSVDVREKRIIVGSRTIPFDAARMSVTDDDILAGAGLFAEWFAIQIKIDSNAATATVHANAPLPFQLRREREREASKTLANAGSAAIPQIPNPYALFDGPFVDTRIRVNSGAGASTSGFDIFATGDLAGLSASAFISGNATHPLAGSWLTLGRRDPDPILLGPLRARQAEGGEVFFPGNDLTSLPRRGTGLVISSFPLDHSAQFDQQTLTGDLRPAEDVELYVNGALAGYARGGQAGGHYTFANIPVIYGITVFRLIFYDAHGQQRIETRTYNVGDSLTQKGVFEYRIEAAGGRLAEAAYGVTRQLTVVASGTSVDLDDGVRHDYLGAGLRTTFRSVFGYGDVTRDTRGGTIARVGLQSHLGPVSIAFSRAQLDAFTSEIYRDDFGPIAARTTFRAGGALGWRHVFPLRLDVATDDLAGGGRITRLGGSISSAIGRLLITNTIQATLFHDVPREVNADSADGTLRFSRFAGELALRGEIAYGIRPRREMTTATIAADWRHFHNIDISASIERNLATQLARNVVSVRRDAGHYAVALAIETSSSGNPVVRVEVSTSLLRNPPAHRWAEDSRPSAAGGAAAAFVFLDRNANGVRDEGEPPIANAGFFVNHGSSPVVTDADGRAFLGRLPAGVRNEVVLSTSTLEDPGWAPATAGAAFVARAGKPLVIDFPVVVTGEIAGTVSRNGKAAAGLHMELVRNDGTIAATGLTAYDGFYDFTGLKPGTYGIRVASEVAITRSVTISADHTFETADFAIGVSQP